MGLISHLFFIFMLFIRMVRIYYTYKTKQGVINMIQEILEMSYGITDSIEKQLMIIKYDRLIDNGFTQKEAINLLLNNAEINTDDSIITTKEDTIYYHDNFTFSIRNII